MIQQGEVYWVDFGEPGVSGAGYRRLAVVLQNNVFNASNIGTVVVCALTSNLRRAGAPGNVLLMPGEANLGEQSVVNVSQVFTVGKGDLVQRIGSLTDERVRAILEGVDLVLKPREIEG